MEDKELLTFNPSPLQYIAKFCIIASAVFTVIGLVLLAQIMFVWSGLIQKGYVSLLFVSLFSLIFLLFAIGKWYIPWRINRYFKGRLVLRNNTLIAIEPDETEHKINSITWYRAGIKELVYLDVFTSDNRRIRYNLKLGTGYTTPMTISFLTREAENAGIEFTVKNYFDLFTSKK